MTNYRNIFLIISSILIIGLKVLNSCEDFEEEELIGNWVEFADFDGLPRHDAVAFVIGNKGYLGTGYNGNENKRLNDFWEFDPSKQQWTQKADFPGTPRNSAIGFALETKGYIGTGYDGKNRLKDFWEYDSQTNTWIQKADFSGSARYGAIAMSVNDKGYVGTGDDGNYLKDFWEYDPIADIWTQKTSVMGSKRRDATCFSIMDKGYVVTGIDNGVYDGELLEYSQPTDMWTKKRPIYNYSDDDYDNDYSTIKGIGKVGFSINGKGYLVTGGQTTGVEVWEYNPITDLWTEKTSFEGSLRTDAVGFVIAERGYLITGRSGNYYFDDVWAFDPDAEYDEDD